MNTKPVSIELVLLIGLITMALLLGALGLYLLQDLSAPLPWQEPSATPTRTRVPPSATITSTATLTSTPTRRPTYTPRLSPTPSAEPTKPDAGLKTPTLLAISPTVAASPTPARPGVTALATSSATPAATSTITPTPSQTATLEPGADTPTPTHTPTATETQPATATPTVTLTPTQIPADYIRIEGRVVRSGEPLAGVTITYEGDEYYTTTTDLDGEYIFGVPPDEGEFYIVFLQTKNEQFTPAADIVAEAWIEGVIEDTQTLTLPDMEVSLLINSQRFALDTPTDGATYQGSAISTSNPIPFTWTIYPGAGSVVRYDALIIPSGDIDGLSVWSYPTSSTNAAVTQPITAGNYWATVRVTLTVDDFTIVITAQPNDLIIN